MRPVDEKIVKMQLENADFENKAKQSLSTLLKLNKGISDVPGVSGLIGAVESISNRFSTMGIIGMTALQNITNKAINAGQRMTKALSMEPMMDGFREYELKMGSIQTILANTSHKGTTLTQVTDVLEDLNEYSDKTIYNFAEMTRNIGTFTAAGVDLKPAAEAIKGIANLAAVSGSNSQQASTAMYQLSQAMAAGTVKLQDWNSVVNAGMGGKVFQNALIETAKAHGKNVDAMIKKNGSFRESLQEGWITTKVLTETLQKFTGDLTDSQLKQMGYTKEQIVEIQKMAKMAQEAATKVRTFTQLIDTTKEALGSGWAKTWEILIGDFNEATELLTEVSNSLGAMIETSSNKRNTLLQELKNIGGLDIAINIIRNSLKAIVSFFKPLRDGFKSVFHTPTATQIYLKLKQIQDITKKLIIKPANAEKLRSFATGIASVLKAGIKIAKEFSKAIYTLVPKGSGAFIFDLLGTIGELLTKFSNIIIYGKDVEEIFGKITGSAKSLASSITGLFKFAAPTGAGIFGFLKAIPSLIGKVISGFTSLLKKIGMDDVVNAGFLGGLLLLIKKIMGFMDGIGGKFDGLFEGIEGLFSEDGLFAKAKDSLNAFSENIKAKSLKEIALSLLILSGALFVIASIDDNKLLSSMAILTTSMLTLISALKLMSLVKIPSFGGKAPMVKFAASILILSLALKMISDIPTNKLKTSVMALGAIMLELSISMAIVAKVGGKFKASMFGLIGLGAAIVIIVQALKMIAEIDEAQLKKALIALTVIMTELTIFLAVMKGARIGVSSGLGILAVAGALVIMSLAVKKLGNIDIETLKKGLGAIGIALLEIGIFSRLVKGGKLMASGAGLILLATGLTILMVPIKKLSEMNLKQLIKGLGSLSIILLALVATTRLMRGGISVGLGLIAISTGVMILVAAVKALGSIPIKNLVVGLAGLMGIFITIGAAAALLSPVIPAMFGIAGALTLVGVGLLAAGAGALMLLEVIDTVAAAPGKLVKTMRIFLKEGIALFTELVPDLVNALLTMFVETLKGLEQQAPIIIDLLGNIIVKMLDGLSVKIPAIMGAFSRFLGAVFGEITKQISKADPKALTDAILTIGAVAVVARLLAGLGSILPSAMIGVLAAGALIAEIAIVLAAIGALNKIPGLKEFVDSGADLLASIGGAIGKFVGSIVSGFATGVTSGFPQIGKDLSGFMTNLKPFIDGSKGIDGTTFDGIGAMAGAILKLTAANIIDGIGRWLTGGNSMEEFGKSLASFGPHLKKYSDSIVGINPNLIQMSATAASALSEFANGLPNEGGLLAKITGDNDILSFGKKIAEFGPLLMQYSQSIVGINPLVVGQSALAARALAQFAAGLPKEGGLVGMITGGNDIVAFGEKLIKFGPMMKAYSDSIIGLNIPAIQASVQAATALSQLAASLPNDGGIASWFTGDNSIDAFGVKIVTFGKSIAEYSTLVKGLAIEPIQASVVAGKALSSLAESMPNDGGIASWFTGDNDMGVFSTKIVAFGNALKSYGASVTGLNTAAISASVASAKNVVEVAKSVPTSGGLMSLITGNNDFGAFGEKMQQFGNALSAYSAAVVTVNHGAVASSITSVNSIMDMLANLDNIASTNITAFKKNVEILGTTAIDKLTQSFAAGETKLKKSFTTTLNTLVNAIKETTPKVDTAIKELTSKFISAIESKRASARAAGASLAKSMMSGLASVSMYSVGTNSADGFIRGMSSRSSRAYSAAASLARTAINAMKTKLDIHSPSRVFDWLADMSVTAFVDRFKNSNALVFDTAESMGGSAISGIENIMRSISDYAGERIELSPVVKPVLDMSNMDTWTPTSGTISVNRLSSVAGSLAYSNDRLRVGGYNNVNESSAESTNIVVNNAGLMDGAVIHIREDADIPKIVREINRQTTDNMRRDGRRIK